MTISPLLRPVLVAGLESNVSPDGIFAKDFCWPAIPRAKAAGARRPGSTDAAIRRGSRRRRCDAIWPPALLLEFRRHVLAGLSREAPLRLTTSAGIRSGAT